MGNTAMFSLAHAGVSRFEISAISPSISFIRGALELICHFPMEWILVSRSHHMCPLQRWVPFSALPCIAFQALGALNRPQCYLL